MHDNHLLLIMRFFQIVVGRIRGLPASYSEVFEVMALRINIINMMSHQVFTRYVVVPSAVYLRIKTW
jgi:hypothetical protein